MTADGDKKGSLNFCLVPGNEEITSAILSQNCCQLRKLRQMERETHWHELEHCPYNLLKTLSH